MGRIKTKQIKAMTNSVYEEHKEKVTTDFAENKALLNEIYADGSSKKLRNVIAGYATRMKKRDLKNAL